MASPKAVVQIFITGTRILGKAFWEASKQAVKNAKHSPQATYDAAGVGTATSGSPTDHLTRLHRMTIDEAHLILNVKRGDPMETFTKHFEHLFKVNSPLPKPEQPTTGKQNQIYHSHYLQSKIFRALERLEAEAKLTTQEAAQKSESMSSQTPPPPPPPPESPHQGSGSQ